MKLYVFDLDNCLCDTEGWKKNWSEISDPLREKLTLLPGAREVLGALDGYKIVVTAGLRKIQGQKIRSLEIDGYFEKMHVVSTPFCKERQFRILADEYREKNNVWGTHVIVIGDRIDHEIQYGNMLGFTTVRVLCGEHAHDRPEHSFQIPRHTIRNLRDILNLPCVKLRTI